MSLIFSWLKRPIPWLIATLLSVPLSAAPYVYVCNNGSDTVSVIDTETNTISGNPITVGSSPFGIAVLPDGSRAYVTVQDDNDVAIIDTASRKMVQYVTLNPPSPNNSYPAGIAVTPDGKKVYVCNYPTTPNSGDYGWIAVINVETGLIETQIWGDGDNPLVGPWGIDISPDGTQAYVCDYDGSSIVVIDTSTDTISSEIALNFSPGVPEDFFPANVDFTPDGSHAYVRSSEYGYVAVITVADGTYIRFPVYSPDLVENSNGGEGITCTPDGTTVYTGNYNYSFITEIPVGTSSGFPVVATGYEPEYIIITSDSTKGYVTCWGQGPQFKNVVPKGPGDSGSVTVFDVATGNTLATISGFTAPEGLAFVILAPPASFTGKVSIDDDEKETSVTTHWTAAPSNYVQQYEIFAYNKKIATINSMAEFRTRIHLHPHPFKKYIKKHYLHFLDQKYKIRAVYGPDSYSTFVPLVSSR